MEKPSEGKKPGKGKLIAFDKLTVPALDDELDSFDEIVSGTSCRISCCRDEPNIITDEEMFESFLNHPPLTTMDNPITVLNIQQHQFDDDALNARRNLPGLQWWRFPIHNIQERPIICYRTNEDDPEGSWKIALPSSLIQPVIYCIILCLDTAVYTIPFGVVSMYHI
jgi:hypothetical protein